jgi:pimeloyl-ACP methyl ester carboxylesterase
MVPSWKSVTVPTSGTSRIRHNPRVDVRVNGVDLFVRTFGDPALPPLVVIHGGPSWDHSYLLPAVGELADTAHVVLFDLRGCGRSHRTPPVGDLPVDALQPELLADDVAGLVRHLGVPRADVLGFSYGGRIALRVVEQHPEVVGRLVLASTTVYADIADEVAASADRRERSALCAPVDFEALTAPGAADGALSRAMAHANAPLDVWRLDRLDEWRAILDRIRFASDYDAPFLAGTLRPGGPADPVRAVRAWGGPTLLLHGARDLTFPVALARRAHADLPGSALAEIPGAGHMAHFDNPRAWLAALRRFL